MSFLPQTVEFDNYEFKVSPKFKVSRKANDENVLLTLYNKEGIGIIIQNRINVLATTVLKNSKGDDLLMGMHRFKHSGYIKELNGYDVSSIELVINSNTTSTKQTFKFKNEENGLEVLQDVRIVNIDNDYYSMYALITAEDKDEYLEVLDEIIFSMGGN